METVWIWSIIELWSHLVFERRAMNYCIDIINLLIELHHHGGYYKLHYFWASWYMSTFSIGARVLKASILITARIGRCLMIPDTLRGMKPSAAAAGHWTLGLGVLPAATPAGARLWFSKLKYELCNTQRGYAGVLNYELEESAAE